MLLSSFLTGFALGFSLILAIGAQNAFVLRQGLLRQPLAQYKGILRTDGENQRKSEGKPGQERRKQHGRQINREWQAKNARTLSGRAR